ncbi:isochorismatase family protein [Lactococcus carnosus]|uniref:isochorismatase family protein n=1 Tax=Pseudolactococcus carnosus TaxID=2749961 RepID=UPI000812B1B9|nr:isochorismatase family protein [Lactococcus carnosus]SCA91151.1 Putative isochorismatase family protein [Lactococcus piscium]MCJ1969037.1 isochorismatase family protein [Lactococcus carnosus]MCJ1973027.1 isochorismatase family protein [Lactococcus carnosus]MCJ1975599.1 isochorismatase family protein [Lactococcus carnosus]MCJ1980867.1 isochorismatase family protein [Lactococcus carnosus]
MTSLNLSKTAYLAIDLQDGILNNGVLAPYTSDAVLLAANQLAEAFKNTEALITLVNVDATSFHYLHPARYTREQPIKVPDNYMQLSMAIATDDTANNVVKVTKHNPGAFFGTDLDLQLRRRGIDTIILSGLTTSNGVYATALDAFQHGYHLYIVEDATSDRDPGLHHLFFDKLYPKLGTVVTLAQVFSMIGR